MKFYGIIPARYQSSRFPGKPLANINGKPMIQRVYEQACKAKCLESVHVATDDERIYNAVKSFNGNAVFTSELHTSGTERCYEAASKIGIGKTSTNVIINIQGDEPYINPEQINQLSKCFTNPTTEIGTLLKEISNIEMLFDENVVKCVFNKNKEAIYFSRNPIPFNRSNNREKWLQQGKYFKHIGIYAYKADVLDEIVKLPPSSLENSESLEQLRWIENAHKVSVEFTDYESISVDTPEDILKINEEKI